MTPAATADRQSERRRCATDVGPALPRCRRASARRGTLRQRRCSSEPRLQRSTSNRENAPTRNDPARRGVSPGMILNRLLAVGIIFAASAGAETFSFGVLGGAPFTDVVNSVPLQRTIPTWRTATNFTVGPTFQVNLPLSLRFEADALYRPYSFLATPYTIPTVP